MRRNKIVFFSIIFSIIIHIFLFYFLTINLKMKDTPFLRKDVRYIRILQLSEIEEKKDKIENITNNNKKLISELEINQKTLVNNENIYTNNTQIKENGNKIFEIMYVPNFKIDKYPHYPLKAKKLGWEGEIILKVYTDNTGKILNIIIEKSTGYELLDNSAISAVKQWNFKKAIVDNDRSVIIFKTKIIFKLE